MTYERRPKKNSLKAWLFAGTTLLYTIDYTLGLFKNAPHQNLQVTPYIGSNSRQKNPQKMWAPLVKLWPCESTLKFWEQREEGQNTKIHCSVSRLVLHRAAMPNIFLSFFIFSVSLLSAAQHLTTADVCDSSFYYVYSFIIIVCV